VSGSPDAREHAARVLSRVDAAGAHAARLLGDATPMTRELVLGVLRWQRTLDHLLAPRLRQPLATLDPPVRVVLRLGLYEALRLRTPAPVAVAEAVRVAKVLAPPASGLVNAVLRRAVESSWPPDDDEALALGLRFSHPDWLVERWRALLGDGVTRAALAADQLAAPLTVLASPLSEAALQDAGCELAPHPWSPLVRVVTGNAAAAVRVIAAGGAYALDATAALVATLAPAVAGRAIDLAAAPGGKLLSLAGVGAALALVGADRHLGRVLMLRRNLQARHIPDVVLAMDGSRPALRPGSFDLVIVDAPCSGTGTLRRHPEIRWRLRRSQLGELVAAQRRLASGASELVAPGGYLLYSTCSIEPEENEQVVEALDLEAVQVRAHLPAGVPCIERAGGGVIIPPTAHGDGFSVHLSRRLAG
jgi:16S rRNA (cytosine967-C5)-methyltransferase